VQNRCDGIDKSMIMLSDISFQLAIATTFVSAVHFKAIDRIRRNDTFLVSFKSSLSHGVCSKFTAAA